MCPFNICRKIEVKVYLTKKNVFCLIYLYAFFYSHLLREVEVGIYHKSPKCWPYLTLYPVLKFQSPTSIFRHIFLGPRSSNMPHVIEKRKDSVGLKKEIKVKKRAKNVTRTACHCCWAYFPSAGSGTLVLTTVT